MHTNQPTYIKAKQAAAILNVSTSHVYAQANSGKWPSYKIAGMRGVRFKEQDIQSLVTKNKPLDTSQVLSIYVTEKSVGSEVKKYVTRIQEGQNVVDEFLRGKPQGTPIH